MKHCKIIKISNNLEKEIIGNNNPRSFQANNNKFLIKI